MSSLRKDIDDNEVIRLYVEEKKSSTEIAKIYGCDHGTILGRLKKQGVVRRNLPEAQHAKWGRERPAELTSYDIMHQLYEVERKTKDELGRIFGVSPSCVGRELQRLGIHIRGNSEATIGTRTGAEHHNWKGGVTALNLRLREFHAINLAPLARERDGYQCQLCGCKSNLHTHHIVPLTKLTLDICAEHPDLDITHNINELYEICTHDSRFLNIGNLITYCKNCHFYKIHKYKKSISSEASQDERSTTISEESTPQAIGGGNGGAPTGA